MKPEDKHALNAAVFRATGEDPTWLGHWIDRFQQGEGIQTAEVADQLGLGVEALVLLCLCKTPRADHFQDDLTVVCQRTGANEDALARIVRQGQALSKWSGRASEAATGWLLAASDGDEEINQSDRKTEEDGDEG
jgi:hypothetical protein